MFSDELINGILSAGRKPEDVKVLVKRFTKAVVEGAMRAEMNEHLGYEKHDPAGANSGNSRNGVTCKTLKGDFGEVEVETPRDRNGDSQGVSRILCKRDSVIHWKGFGFSPHFSR